MEASRSNPALAAARIEELQRENQTLREQLQSYAAQQTVVRGALTEAAHEKEATARIAHQVAVEERATRTAVEVQNSTLGFAAIMQIVSFFILLIMIIGMFVWLPREIERRVAPSTTIVTPGGTVVPR
jgi:hypothetical protein